MHPLDNSIGYGSQRRAAERLLAASADNVSPAYANNQTALDQTVSPDTRCGLLASWLREHGATSADGD